jgi:hypothetical protein
MEQAQAERLLGRLVAAYPSRQLTDDSVELFIEKLAKERFEDASVGVEKVIETGKFFPSWAELREAIPHETAAEFMARVKREKAKKRA